MGPRPGTVDMMRLLGVFDRHLANRSAIHILLLAAAAVVAVGALDFASGYEVSMSVFYLGPVALAAWYANRRIGLAVALLSCLSWYIADTAAGSHYSHPVIPVWNALVRLAFFLITAELLAMLRRSLRRNQHLARTDGLTGLYGRRAFEDRLAHDLEVARRRREPLALAYVDVDDFKAVNDTHGHAGGDRVLREIGRVLEHAVREADTAARVGGDEFALVFPDTDEAGARRVVSKLAAALRESLDAEGFDTTVSIGVVIFNGPPASPGRAVAAADEAMYRVKQGGKNAIGFHVFDRSPESGNV